MNFRTSQTRRARIAAVAILGMGIAAHSAAFASEHDESPVENSAGLSLINAVSYFQSLGWDFQTGTWSGTASVLDTDLGSGATVAILDGLANEAHTDLPFATDPLSQIFIFTGFPFSPSYTAPDLHGSHTSGIVAARLDGTGMAGVAPTAHVLNYAVFDDNGWVGVDENEVLTHARDMGASVVNMSYGPVTSGDLASSTTLSAINAHKSSLVVVKSAGNDGVVLGNEALKGRNQNPLTNLIIAGAVDASGSIAWYSNTPGTSCITSKGNCTVPLSDIFMVAPGGSAVQVDENGFVGGIWSTDELGGYYRISGTSMAAPYIAGAVALLHSRWDILKSDPLTTRNVLFETANKTGIYADAAIYGQGLLDVGAAMNPVGAPTFGITAGGGDGGGNGGGGNGRGKPKKNQSWTLADTSLVAQRGLAALSQTGASVSVFDKFRRDFPVALSSLVRTERSYLAKRLELMVSSDYSLTGSTDVVPGRDDLFQAVTAGYQSLSDFAPTNLMADLELRGITLFDVTVFGGTGNALPVFYTPVAHVGTLAADSAIEGINPFLGFAAGSEFVGASLGRVGGRAGPVRFALGYSRNETREAVLDNYRAGATAASVSFAATQSQTWNVAVTVLRETGGVFGSRASGALGFGEQSQTRALTLSWDNANWHGLALTASYTMGATRGNAAALLAVDDQTLSEAFHLGLAKAGLFSAADRVTLTLSQPLRVVSGSVHLYADQAFNVDGVMQMQSETISLVPTGRELDVQMEYGFDLAAHSTISAFAFHALDAGHRAAAQESGLGLKFQHLF